MKKIKLNFNSKSYTAWITLLMAIVSAGVAILKVFGIEVTPDQTNDVTLIITTVLNVFVAAGILTQPMDKKEDK